MREEISEIDSLVPETSIARNRELTKEVRDIVISIFSSLPDSSIVRYIEDTEDLIGDPESSKHTPKEELLEREKELTHKALGVLVSTARKAQKEAESSGNIRDAEKLRRLHDASRSLLEIIYRPEQHIHAINTFTYPLLVENVANQVKSNLSPDINRYLVKYDPAYSSDKVINLQQDRGNDTDLDHKLDHKAELDRGDTATYTKREEQRETVDGEPLFEKTEGGFKGYEEQNLVRNITWGDTGEPSWMGQIETGNQEIFHQLFVTSAWNLRPDGLLERADTRFSEINLPSGEALDKNSFNDADITFPVKIDSPDNFIDLPVPYGYAITWINQPCKIERSNLGNYRISNLSKEVPEIKYRVSPREFSQDISNEERKEWAQDFQGDEIHRSTEIVDKLAASEALIRKKVELIAGGVRSLNPVYSDHASIGAVYDACGKDRYLAYEAMQIGHCDSFAAHLANRLRHHNIPALVVAGLTANLQERAFDGSCGHSITLYFNEEGSSTTIDATTLTDKRAKIDPNLITQEDINYLLDVIPFLTNEELFAKLRSFTQSIKIESEGNGSSSTQPSDASSYSSEYQPSHIDQSSDSGKFIKFVNTVSEWETDSSNPNILDKIPEYFRIFKDLYDSGINFTKHWALEFFGNDEFQDKYAGLFEQNWISVVLSVARNQLDRKDVPEDNKQQFKDWVIRNLSYRISPDEALYLLSNDDFGKVEIHSLASFCQKALMSRSDNYSSEDFGEGRGQTAYTNYYQRIRALSEIVRSKSSTDERIFFPVINSSRNYDMRMRESVASDLMGKTSLSPDALYLQSYCETISNLMEASGDKENLFIQLIFPFNDNKCRYRSHQWLKLVQVLTKTKLFTQFLTPDGKATELLKTEFQKYIYTERTLSTLSNIPLPHVYFDYLESLGIEPGKIFHPDFLKNWLNNLVLNRPMNINIPEVNGQMNFEHPASALIYFNPQIDQDYFLDGSAPFRTINVLSERYFPDKLDDILSVWHAPSETSVAEEYFINRSEIFFNEQTSSMFIHDERNDLFNMPLSFPKDVRSYVAQQSRFLSALEKQSDWESTDSEIAWDKVYDLNPAVKDHLTQTLLSPERLDQVRNHLLNEYVGEFFNSTERYEITLAISMLIDHQGSNTLKSQLIAGLCNISDSFLDITEEEINDPDKLRVKLESLIQNNLVNFAGYKEFIGMLKPVATDPMQIYRVFLVLGEAFREFSVQSYDFPKNNLATNFGVFCQGHYMDDIKGVFAPLDHLDSRQSVQQDTTLRAKRLGSMIENSGRYYGFDHSLLKDELRQIRSLTVDRPSGSSPISFARYLTDILGQRAKIKSAGGEVLELREYQPGDDIRRIDWNVTERLGKPHTKVMNEQMINPVHFIIDAEWLAQTSDVDVLPENVRNVLVMCYLAFKERIPLNLHVFFRGSRLMTFNHNELTRKLGHLKETGIDRQSGEETIKWSDEDFLNRLWVFTSHINDLLETERKNNVELPPSRVVQEPWLPPKPASVIFFSGADNLKKTTGVLEAMEKQGISVQVATRGRKDVAK